MDMLRAVAACDDESRVFFKKMYTKKNENQKPSKNAVMRSIESEGKHAIAAKAYTSNGALD